MNGGTRVDGSCYCAAVRFSLELPVHEVYHCHCSVCRRLHAAPWVTWVKAPGPHLHVHAGAGQLRGHPLRVEVRRFCGACGSTVFAELIEPSADAPVWVPRAVLYEPRGLEPSFHKYVGSRAAWVRLDDGLPQFEENGSLSG